MSEFAESRSGYPKFFRASPFADKVVRNASPVPALLAIAGVCEFFGFFFFFRSDIFSPYCEIIDFGDLVLLIQ